MILCVYCFGELKEEWRNEMNMKWLCLVRGVMPPGVKRQGWWLRFQEESWNGGGLT